MAWLVIVWQLSVEYRRILSVGKSVGINHRRIYSVGNYGMAGNCLATLCGIPTDIIRRYIRW
jgi:hypothetical protein